MLLGIPVSIHTLGIENLSANNAVFNMNVDLETQTADKLNITDSYSGNANLKLTNVHITALIPFAA